MTNQIVPHIVFTNVSYWSERPASWGCERKHYDSITDAPGYVIGFYLLGVLMAGAAFVVGTSWLIAALYEFLTKLNRAADAILKKGKQ